MMWVILFGIVLSDSSRVADALSKKFTEMSTLNSLTQIIAYYRNMKHGDVVLTLGVDRVYLQQHENGCAAACVAMVLDRIHVPVGFADVSKGLRSGENGEAVSMLQLKIYIEDELGLKGVGYKGNASELEDREAPVILFVDGGHYVVLSSITKDGAIILDPAMGRQYWSPEMLKKDGMASILR